MPSRRQILRLSLPTLAVLAAPPPAIRASSGPPPRVYLPIAQAAAQDAPILGPASGTAKQAIAWLAARCSGYAAGDVAAIVARYRDLGEWAGMDWFLALAQMAHETGHITSWWSQRPRRNPAGIGVTGRVMTGNSLFSPGARWGWDEAAQLWREGVSFPTWNDHGIPAHLGRLLAYALADSAATDPQRQLIDYALLIRSLPAQYRGVAPTAAGLNGRWAVPGEGYGQRIVALAQRMAAG